MKGDRTGQNTPRQWAMELAFATLHVRAFATAAASISGLGIALPTLVLLVGAQFGGQDSVTGPHLALLGQVLPGYTVSWVGVMVGFAYGSVIGALAGGIIAYAWNSTRNLYLLLRTTKLRLTAPFAD